jgi:hypothetical protein
LPLEVRFWRFVYKTDTCWLWTGKNNARGYAVFSTGEKSFLAYRFAYNLSVGPVPEGLELDHTCEVIMCVNPAHLEPVTHAVNMRRLAERRRTRAVELAMARARIADLETQLRIALDELHASASNAPSRNP